MQKSLLLYQIRGKKQNQRLVLLASHMLVIYGHHNGFPTLTALRLLLPLPAFPFPALCLQLSEQLLLYLFFSSSIHSMAQNPSLAKQLLAYASWCGRTNNYFSLIAFSFHLLHSSKCTKQLYDGKVAEYMLAVAILIF